MPKGEKKRKYSDAMIDRLRNLIEVQKVQQWKAAKALGVGHGTVEKWCRRFHLKTQRTGPRNGEDHPGWNGGRTLVGQYWYIYSPNHPHHTKQNRVAEHRLVMEKKLGRYLLPSEVVHHIDGNPQNNHPDNLQHFQTNGQHLAHELKGKCPKWTPDGLRRIQEGNQKPKKPWTRSEEYLTKIRKILVARNKSPDHKAKVAAANLRRNATHLQSTADAHPLPPPTDHQPSSVGNTHAAHPSEKELKP